MQHTDPQNILNSRNLTLRLTRWGVLYGFVTVALLLCSMNYSISLGYCLSFFMMGFSIIAFIHGWRNMSNLEIDTSLLTAPVFLGETIFVCIKIINKKSFTSFTINTEFPTFPSVVGDIASIGDNIFSVPIKTKERGWLHLPILHIFSEYPIGLFRVSAILNCRKAVLVYARPQAPQLETSRSKNSEIAASLNDLHIIKTMGDDFNGHRAYQTNDSINHVDWKASSRHGALLTKKFIANQEQSVWLDWGMTENLPFETRISRLTFAVTAFHDAQMPYGLKLPTAVFSPNLGLNHYHECLQALALMK